MSPDPDHTDAYEPQPPAEGETVVGDDGVARWVPKFPDLAEDAGKVVREPEGEYQAADNMTWASAPAGSHVHSFGYRAGTHRKKDVVLRDTVVVVIFRSGRTGLPSAQYAYTFDSSEAGRAVFDELKASDHPGAHPMIQTPRAGAVPGLVGYTRQ